MTSCSYCGEKHQASSRIPEDYPDKCSGCPRDSCAACQKLKVLDEKIRNARAALDLLLDEREAMASVLNETHDPLTKRLPVELVSRVFTACIPAWLDLCTPRTALSLSQVCRRWRRVAHNTSALWTSIGVTQGAGKVLLGKDEMLETCLVRSGDLPLSIFIFMSDEDPDNPISFEALRSSIVLLCRQARRWVSLMYEGNYSTLGFIATSAISLDSLRSMSLDCYYDAHQDSVALNASLSSLSSNTLPEQLGIHIDYAALTEIKLTPFSLIVMSHCVKVFREASQLETCEFGDITLDGDFDLQQHPAVARSLRSLSILSFPDPFWEVFDFPSLTKLEVGTSIEGTGWTVLERCLIRSCCKLQNLLFMGEPPSDREVIQVLSATPHLRQLYFARGVTTAELFSVLYKSATTIAVTENATSEQFLNRLTTLSCCSESHISWEWPVLFLNAMTARPEQTLRTFSFTCLEADAMQKTIQAVDKLTLGHLLAVASRLEFKTVFLHSNDMLRDLCAHHEVDFTTGSVL